MDCCLKEKKMCFGNWLDEDDYTQQFSINEQSGPKILSYVNTVVHLKSELPATHCFNFQLSSRPIYFLRKFCFEFCDFKYSSHTDCCANAEVISYSENMLKKNDPCIIFVFNYLL